MSVIDFPTPGLSKTVRSSALAMLALAGCGLSDLGDAGEAAPATAQIDEALYGFGTISRRWPNGVVPVCVRDPDSIRIPLSDMRDAATDTWSAAASIAFKGWGPCTRAMQFLHHVEIAVSREQGYRSNASALGYGTPVITVAESDWFLGPARFRSLSIHELGHILGFPHEMRRPDNWVGGSPVQCGVPTSNSDYPQYASQPGGVYLTAEYDIYSIMNYYYVGGNSGPGCNPVVYQHQLSAADIAGVQRLDAYGPPQPPTPRQLLVAPRATEQSGTGLRIESLVPARAPNAWSLLAQDIDPSDAFDTASWKVIGDVNGDSRSDLVSVRYLGPPADPSNCDQAPTGLRIQTALSAGPGTWTFTVQDIDPTYPRDDAANWKPAGDLNADGRADLFNVERSVSGGLRIQAALSTGPGTWTLVAQDIVADAGSANMAHWIASDINGDGRPDLFNTGYLPPNDSGTPAGVRVLTAFSTSPGTWNLTAQNVQLPLVPDDLAAWHPAVFNRDGRHDVMNLIALRGDFPQVIAIRLLSSANGAWRTEISSVGMNTPDEDLASVRIGDFNGDGLTDVASPMLTNTGLRVRTAFYGSVLGTGVVNTFHDVDPAYATSDATKWQVMDFDDDNVSDLVLVESLGPAGGLRIKQLVSNADGTWALTTQNVDPAGSASSPAGWQVAAARN